MKKEELQQAMQLIYDILEDDKFLEAVTSSLWKLFIKLKEKGFTEDQAMRIVTNFNSKK